MRFAARIHVLAGPFASQQLAFAHLLDAAQRDGLSPDFDHIEIVLPGQPARLRHYFTPDLVDALTDTAQQDALILVLPGALITGTFQADDRLRDLGNHPGHVTRALL